MSNSLGRTSATAGPGGSCAGSGARGRSNTKRPSRTLPERRAPSPRKSNTKGLAGWVSSVSAVSSCSTDPRRSTAMRSATSNASSRSWVTRIVVSPRRSCRPRRIALSLENACSIGVKSGRGRAAGSATRSRAPRWRGECWRPCGRSDYPPPPPARSQPRRPLVPEVPFAGRTRRSHSSVALVGRTRHRPLDEQPRFVQAVWPARRLALRCSI